MQFQNKPLKTSSNHKADPEPLLERNSKLGDNLAQNSSLREVLQIRVVYLTSLYLPISDSFCIPGIQKTALLSFYIPCSWTGPHD